MAKHSKKNNIISYDEAKHKKELEKEELLRKAARHSMDAELDEIEENDSGYNNDEQNTDNFKDIRHNRANTRERARRVSRENNSDDDVEYDEELNSNRFNARYSNNNYNENDIDNSEDYEDAENFDDEGNSFKRRGGKYSQPPDPLPRNLLNFIIIAAMSIFLIGFVIFFLSQYVVKTINIIGNDTIKYHEITTLCGIEYKESMFKVKEEDVTESFESQKPMIEVVEVKKIWPDIVEIYVKERPPICFVVLKGSQKCALIGEGNICLAIEDSYLKGDLPRIYGLDIGDAEIGKVIEDGDTRKLEVLETIMNAMNESGCISELESININNTTNITMESTSGTSIIIGDTSNILKKFEVTKLGIYKLIEENNTDVTMIVPGDNTFHIK